MDVVFLTGAGSEPAQSIARRLVGAGFRVYGFSGQFPRQGFQHRDFIPVPLNLADPAAVRAEVASILAAETMLSGVILAGNYPVEEPFEATHAEDIALALNAGVVSPLTLVRAALPLLVRQRGHVIAVTHAPNGPGAALAATVDGALRHFARTLFDELRDTGVKAAHLRLENNPGAADPAARFTHAPQSAVQPDIVADAVETLLRLRENNALTELVLRPQATREEPRLPVSAEPRLRTIQVVQLPPPQNFPPPQENIPTPERKRPDYAPPPGENVEDLYADDDEGVDPELLYLIKPNYQRHLASGTQPAQSAEEDARQDNRPPRRDRTPRDAKPRDGALRIRPPSPGEQPVPPPPGAQNKKASPQDNRQPEAERHLPYPPNWHWPRPPSPQQLERIARRKAQQQNQSRRPAPFAGERENSGKTAPPPAAPKTTPAPAPEFVPPPPRDNTREDIPVFVPPVSQPATPAAGKPAEERPVSPDGTTGAVAALPLSGGSADTPAKRTSRKAGARKTTGRQDAPAGPDADEGKKPGKAAPARKKKTTPKE